jgi:hypothetical protein
MIINKSGVFQLPLQQTNAKKLFCVQKNSGTTPELSDFYFLDLLRHKTENVLSSELGETSGPSGEEPFWIF